MTELSEEQSKKPILGESPRVELQPENPFIGTEQEIITKSWNDQPEIEKDLKIMQENIKIHNEVHDKSADFFRRMATVFNIMIPMTGFIMTLLSIIFKVELKDGYYYVSEIGPLLTPLLWLIYKWYDPVIQMQQHLNASSGKAGISSIIEEMLDMPLNRRDELAHTFRRHMDYLFADIKGRGPYLFDRQLKSTQETTKLKIEKKPKSKKD